MEITILSTWSTAGLIADIALLAILLISIIRGARKGFTYGVVWLASILAGIIAARLVSGLFTEPISNFVYGLSKNGVEKTVESLTPDLNGVDWSKIDFSEDREEKLSDEEFEQLLNNEGFAKMADIMTKLGIKRDSQKERFYSMGKGMYEKQESGKEYVREYATRLAQRAITFTVRVILIIITFVVVLFLLRRLAEGMSRLVDKIPLIGTLDHILGGALNVAVAIALIWLFLYVWHIVSPETYEKVTAGAPLMTIAKDYNPLISFFG